MTRRHPNADTQQAAEKAAWLFYTIAALGSSIGQIWVGVTVPPWPDAFPWWARAIAVLPFAIVIDLGGVVASAFADWRQRLGETAYGWRVLSLASVAVGVGINIIGHAGVPYLAVVFGGLGVFAYSVWLLHSAARRRDALRIAGKLGETAPAYGIVQWIREPEVTRRAKQLALTERLALYESLALARVRLAAEAQQANLSHYIEQLIRDQHTDNPVLASIAVGALPTSEVAAALTALMDVDGWANAIGVHLRPPAVDIAPLAEPTPERQLPAVTPLPVDVMRRIPAAQEEYDQWRELWRDIRDSTDTNGDLATRFGVSIRQIQWIRVSGKSGLLESPVPPALRLVQLAQTASANGHHTDPLNPAS